MQRFLLPTSKTQQQTATPSASSLLEHARVKTNSWLVGRWMSPSKFVSSVTYEYVPKYNEIMPFSTGGPGACGNLEKNMFGDTHPCQLTDWNRNGWIHFFMEAVLLRFTWCQLFRHVVCSSETGCSYFRIPTAVAMAPDQAPAFRQKNHLVTFPSIFFQGILLDAFSTPGRYSAE